MIAMRKVLDLSHHNEILSWHEIVAAGVRGIIHKATEGASYTDGTYAERSGAAAAHGLLWGAYHFANASYVEAQVDNFLSVVGLRDDVLYALDWEDNGDNTMSLDQAREFIERLEARIGRYRAVIYSGNTAKEALGSREDEFFGARRLWLAQYGSDPEPQASWEDWWLWQYSDGEHGPGPHGCPGCGGAVDTNSYAGTDDDLAAEWSGAEGAGLEPEVAAVAITIEATGPVTVTINGRPLVI